MFSETPQRRKFAKAAIREGEAPAEPSSWATLSGRSGSAGASPSLQGAAIDFLRTGLLHWLKSFDGNDFLRLQYRTWRRLVCCVIFVFASSFPPAWK